jgi:hypothetical protein
LSRFNDKEDAIANGIKGFEESRTRAEDERRTIADPEMLEEFLVVNTDFVEHIRDISVLMYKGDRKEDPMCPEFFPNWWSEGYAEISTVEGNRYCVRWYCYDQIVLDTVS